MTKNEAASEPATGLEGGGFEGIREEPKLLPLLPLIYVVWSEGVATDTEISAVRDAARAAPWLDDRARAILDTWLDPGSPPSPTRLEALSREIREAGKRVPESQRGTLAELGIALARIWSGDPAGTWSQPEYLEALRDIEAAAGVVGAEALRELFAAPPEERPSAVAPEAPSFDPAALHRLLDADHWELRQEVLGILADPRFHTPPELDSAAYRAWVLDRIQDLADRGLSAVAYPVEYGGRGDVAGSIAVFETLAFGDLSVLVKFGVQFGLFGGSIYSLGTRKHHERYLRDVISLKLPGCYAMTESAHGSNVRGIETTATYDPETDGFIIHTPTPSAKKEWIGNAALHGRMATVFAQLRIGDEEHGVHAFLVPIRDAAGNPLPGVEIGDCGLKEGLLGIDNGTIAFNHVRIPRENLLDRFGEVHEGGRYSSPIPSQGRRFFTMLGTLVAGRISVAAAANSAAKTGLTIAVRHTAWRRQFGPAGAPEVPVLDYRTMQRRLLPHLATTYALDFALKELTQLFARRVSEGDLKEVEALAAGLKAYASWHTVETLQNCREACGGEGYRASNRFGALKADTDVFTTFEGDNVVLMQLVARSLLTQFREELGELRFWGIARHLARAGARRLVGANPVIARRTDDAHLRDPEFQRGALRFREERLLTTAARRMQGRISAGQDSFDALNEVQDHLVSLARAHVERVLFDHFQEGITRQKDLKIIRVLRTLRDLYALSRIEADRGWFLEAGYLEPPKTKAIRDLVNRLCAELRPDAVGLVDAFGIPDPVLRAPIAVER